MRCGPSGDATARRYAEHLTKSGPAAIDADETALRILIVWRVPATAINSGCEADRYLNEKVLLAWLETL